MDASSFLPGAVVEALQAELRLTKQRLYELEQKTGLQFPRILETGEHITLLKENNYPVLHKISDLSYERTEQPLTKLIEGENFSALLALHQNYKNKVDVIYIDPPYNTGNTHFVYQDSRKSAWLTFMETRLTLAYDLLAPTGLIAIAIGEDEYFRLKLLLDSIFGEKNLIANLIWQGSPSYLSKYTSGGVDYMLVYAKDTNQQSKWRKEKPHAKTMIKLVKEALEGNATLEEATLLLRNYIQQNSSTMDKGLQLYNRVDKEGRIFSNASLTNGLYRPNLIYPVTDPETGRVYDSPENGWKLSPDTMNELIEQDLVLFGDRKYPRKKLLLEDYMFMLPSPVFTAYRKQGSAMLDSIIGKNKFPFPKNVSVLKEWFTIFNNKPDAVFLDFFAGSGTTGHAVIEMNAEDEGRRECILVTHGEDNGVSIASDIARVRLQRVLTGKDWADGETRTECKGSLLYYQVGYTDDVKIVMSLNQKEGSYESVLAAHRNPLEALNKLNPTFGF